MIMPMDIQADALRSWIVALDRSAKVLVPVMGREEADYLARDLRHSAFPGLSIAACTWERVVYTNGSVIFIVSADSPGIEARMCGRHFDYITMHEEDSFPEPLHSHIQVARAAGAALAQPQAQFYPFVEESGQTS